MSEMRLLLWADMTIFTYLLSSGNFSKFSNNLKKKVSVCSDV